MIYLGLVVKTKGWLGFAIGEPTSGSMNGADFITGSIDDIGKNITIHDRYSFIEAEPIIDDCQDWTLIRGEQTDDGWSVLEVSRKLDTGDNQDRAIKPGENRILWAIGRTDTFGYHGPSSNSRGVSVLSFYDAPIYPYNEEDIFYEYKFKNASVPARKTTYMCQAFGFFPLPFEGVEEAQIIQIDPLVDQKNIKYVHHYQLHLCDFDTNSSTWQTYQDPTICNGLGMRNCESVIYAWALGIGSLVLPKDVGFLVSEKARGGAKFIVLEIHYDNSDLRSDIVDTSGVRLHFTKTLRKYNAGVMKVGDPGVTFPPIPPGISEVPYEAECPSECTSLWSHEINVIGSFLHMHEIGKRMFTSQHDKNGKLIRITNKADFYRFSFQQYTAVNYTIKPGDRLNTHCIYDSTQRVNYTDFDDESNDEMCMEFITYYPVLLTPQDRIYSGCGFANLGGNRTDVTFCGSLADVNSAIRDDLKPNLRHPDPDNINPQLFGKPCSSGNWFQNRSTLQKGLIIGIPSLIVVIVVVIVVLKLRSKPSGYETF